MTKIEITDGDFAELEYRSASAENSQEKAEKPNIVNWGPLQFRSKRITQLLGSGIVLGLIFWAGFIVISGKNIASFDVITFELAIATIICIAIAVHLRRTAVS